MIQFFFASLISLSTAQSCLQGYQKIDPHSGQLQSGSCRELEKFSFSQITIPNTNLSDNKFSSSEFNRVKIVGTSFTRSEFSSSYVTNVETQKGPNFAKTKWKGSLIEDSNLKNTQFSESQWFGSKIIKTQLTESSFHKATGQNCYFQQVSFDGADLRGADFETCLFWKVSLKNALYNKDTKLPISKAEMQSQGMIYKP